MKRTPEASFKYFYYLQEAHLHFQYRFQWTCLFWFTYSLQGNLTLRYHTPRWLLYEFGTITTAIIQPVTEVIAHTRISQTCMCSHILVYPRLKCVHIYSYVFIVCFVIYAPTFSLLLMLSAAERFLFLCIFLCTLFSI